MTQAVVVFVHKMSDAEGIISEFIKIYDTANKIHDLLLKLEETGHPSFCDGSIHKLNEGNQDLRFPLFPFPLSFFLFYFLFYFLYYISKFFYISKFIFPIIYFP